MQPYTHQEGKKTLSLLNLSLSLSICKVCKEKKRPCYLVSWKDRKFYSVSLSFPKMPLHPYTKALHIETVCKGGIYTHLHALTSRRISP